MYDFRLIFDAYFPLSSKNQEKLGTFLDGHKFNKSIKYFIISKHVRSEGRLELIILVLWNHRGGE